MKFSEQSGPEGLPYYNVGIREMVQNSQVIRGANVIRQIELVTSTVPDNIQHIWKLFQPPG